MVLTCLFLLCHVSGSPRTMAANSSFVLISKSLVRVSPVCGVWVVSGWRVLLRFLLVLFVPPPEVRGVV